MHFQLRYLRAPLRRIWRLRDLDDVVWSRGRKYPFGTYVAFTPSIYHRLAGTKPSAPVFSKCCGPEIYGRWI